MDISTSKLTVLDQIASSDKVRRKIMDAASALYAKKGFAATSIQEISEKAGVRKGRRGSAGHAPLCEE